MTLSALILRALVADVGLAEVEAELERVRAEAEQKPAPPRPRPPPPTDEARRRVQKKLAGIGRR
jgi:hypothetical protein